MKTTAYIQHALFILLLTVIVFIHWIFFGAFTSNDTMPDPFKVYGKWQTIVMYAMRYMILISLPMAICNCLGIIMFNTQHEKQRFSPKSLSGSTLVCFRVVTKGLYPELVKRTVNRNVNLCSALGLKNFIFHVVTDTPVHIPFNASVLEIVVPSSYVSTKGTLYKARALQYCLEDKINELKSDDWIVHLDEETILTKNSVIGIMNFIHESKYEIGQGIITYANEKIVNWLTTMADLIRVGIDYGITRFSLNFLHKPLFGLKGSFIVVRVDVELAISFDFGIEGSITEDCFFALTAWENGYRFGFISAEVWEKSPFTLFDFIKQRKRWAQGLMLVNFSTRINPQYKIGIAIICMTNVFMPFTMPNFVLMPLFPLPMPKIFYFLFGFNVGIVCFLFIFGFIKSFSYQKLGIFKYCFMLVVITFLWPIFIFLDIFAVVLALFSPIPQGFYIVDKEING